MSTSLHGDIIESPAVEPQGLVYIGKIEDLQPIPGADFIMSATAVCGQGGKWRGVVKKDDFKVGSPCVVYLPDSLLPVSEEFKFMAATNWRVKMRRFKGAPSEALIMPIPSSVDFHHLGFDVTSHLNVTRYIKPMPAHLNGIAIGHFPDFIPKTDEPNWQACDDLVQQLVGKPYYITEKCDGSSTTAYRWKNRFGVCSRNLELEKNPENGYWKVALKYKLDELLPEGYAIQWETCGPGIQANPMGLKEIDGFVFSGYKIDEYRYLTMIELWNLVKSLKMPTCTLLEFGDEFSDERLEEMGEGFYASNAKPREGVVIRSQVNHPHRPISFKVINLGYEK